MPTAPFPRRLHILRHAPQALSDYWAHLGLGRKLDWIAGFALAPALCLLALLLYYDGREALRLRDQSRGLALLQRTALLQGELEHALEAHRAAQAADGFDGMKAAWPGLKGPLSAWGQAALADALERVDSDWQNAADAETPALRESALRTLRDDLPRLDQRLSEATRLTRDDSLARLGLVRAAGNSLPFLEAQLSRLRDLESDTTATHKVGDSQRRDLLLQQSLFSQQMAQALQDLESAFADDPGLKSRLIDDFGDSPLGLFQVSADRYASAVQEYFDSGAKDPQRQAYCSTRYGQLLDARSALYGRLQELLGARLRQRAWVLLGEVLLLSLVTLALFVLSLALARRAARGVLQPLQRLGEASRLVAREGDLSVRVSEDGRDEVGQLAKDFNAMIEGLSQALEGADVSAVAMRHAAEALRAAMADQQVSTSSQDAALQQALVTSDEIRQTSTVTSRRARQVQDHALAARASSLQGSEALAEGQQEMKDMASAVRDLREQLEALPERLGKVEAVADSVKELAVQSNVLALNAAIEALRAGEGGRSFGLVAREMRALADRSAVESQRVASLLADLGAATRAAAKGAVTGGQRLDRGLASLAAGNRSLQDLAEVVEQGAEQASQIAEAVHEQGVGLDQLLAALGDQEALMLHTVQGSQRVQALIQPLLSTAADLEARSSRWTRRSSNGPR